MREKIYTEVPMYGKIELIDYYEHFISYYQKCEMETKRWVVDHVKEDWIIFDCGANIGYYAILFAKLAREGLVYAFEPTDTIDKLVNNIKYHNISNVIPLNFALSNKTCFKKDKIYKIWGSDPEIKNFNFITLDDFCENNSIQKVDLIKIDVDSYDFEVLQGAEYTLKKFNPFVIVELNHALSLRNTSNYAAIKWMKSQGYEAGLVLDDENIVFKKGYDFTNTNFFNLCFNKPKAENE